MIKKAMGRFGLSGAMRGALACLAFASFGAAAADLTVRMSGFVNDEGRVQCGLFNQAEGWRVESRAWKVLTEPIHARRAVCAFGDIPPGRYAVAVFHAPKGEQQVSYGLFGKPLQGVGFSNNPSITWGPPSFESALITVGQNPSVLDVEIKY